MMRRICPAVAILLLLAGVSGWSVAFDHGPYSGAPSDDSVTISWTASALVPAHVEYGPWAEIGEGNSYRHTLGVPVSVEEPSDTVHVALTDLHADTRYAYRVILHGEDGDVVSPVGRFSTAPAPGKDVSFAVLSDTQQQLEGVNRLELVGTSIAADPAEFDFMLHAGDVVESPSSFYWDDWFSSFNGMLSRAPFIPVLGNHEKNHRSYYETFSLPPGAGKDDKRWWALHWGDVVVVGLDTNASKATEITAQQDWAREHLSGLEPHKFVIFHHPVFSSDAYHGTGYFFDKIYHPIFIETGVDVVFNGHSHHYEHIVRDGVTYLVVGGGGATPRTTTPEHIQGSDVSVEGHHFYVRVSTSTSGIEVETVSVAREEDGEAVLTPDRILDAFELASPSTARFPIWVPVVAALALLLVLAACVLRLRACRARARSETK